MWGTSILLFGKSLWIRLTCLVPQTQRHHTEQLLATQTGSVKITLQHLLSVIMLFVSCCHGYLTCSKGFDVPEELGNILDGHLEAKGVCSERQHLWLLKELTASAPLCRHHSLERRYGKERNQRRRRQQGETQYRRKTNEKHLKLHWGIG